MSESRSLVTIDDKPHIILRAKTAWRILKGNRFADPIYVELKRIEQNLTNVDAALRQVLDKTDSHTVGNVNKLVTTYRELKLSLVEKEGSLDQFRRSHNEVVQENAALKNKIQQLDEKLLDLKNFLVKMKTDSENLMSHL